MNKKEFVAILSARACVTEAQVCAVLDAGHVTICELLGKGDSVNMMGLGQILLKPRAASKARDVRRGVPVDVGPRATIRFKATRSVVDRLSGTSIELLKKGRKA